MYAWAVTLEPLASVAAGLLPACVSNQPMCGLCVCCSRLLHVLLLLQIEFLRPMTAGILSERRSVPPFGLFGGRCGEKGTNLLIRSSGRVVNLGGKATVQLQAGDVMRICTPGAGGFGAVQANGGGAGGEDAAGKAPPQQQRPPQFDVVGSVDTYRRLQETA